MHIEAPTDLFSVYEFGNDDVKLKITQFFNKDKNIIKYISALCLYAKISKKNATHLQTNYYLVKMHIKRTQKSLTLTYKVQGEKICFVWINY